MIFTKRERLVALVTVLSVGLFALNRYALMPFLEYRSQINASRANVAGQLERATRLVESRPELDRKWNTLLAEGLKATPSEAESQVLHAVRDWAQEAGVVLSSLKPERTVVQERFQEISFHANGNGSMAGIARLLWRLESAVIPIRVNSMQILPHGKEATDDLTVQLSISTLCLNPETPKAATRAGANKEKTTP